MRDILIALIVGGAIPFILMRPYIGALLWVLFSVMNPHTLAYGFAYDFPWLAIIGGTTLVSLVFTKDPKELPITPLVIVFIIFVLWMNVTTLTAVHPELVFDQWNKVMKIMLMVFVGLMLIKTKQQVQMLIGIIVFSFAYYGVKGGVFTITTGGDHLVWGPGDSITAGNNEMALALVMTIPLIHYFHLIAKKVLVRHCLTIAMLLCAVAALGSYSRGALLALMSMGMVLVLKSQHKFRLLVLLILAVPVMLALMPGQWSERMSTLNAINSYEPDRVRERITDRSALGRLNAWAVAANLAMERPIQGGGFEIVTRRMFDRYAPDKKDIPRAMHSIYFQALGEHGFIGLGLYLLLGFMTWRTGTWIIRNTKGIPVYQWAYNLAAMIQVSLIGFSVGGAFLSLLYFEVPLYLMSALIITRIILEKELEEKIALAATPIAKVNSSQEPEKLAALQPITRDSG